MSNMKISDSPEQALYKNGRPHMALQDNWREYIDETDSREERLQININAPA